MAHLLRCPQSFSSLPATMSVHPSIRRALQMLLSVQVLCAHNVSFQLLKARQHAHISFLMIRAVQNGCILPFFRGKSCELCGLLCFFPFTRIICHPSILKTKRKMPEDGKFLILLLQTLTYLLSSSPSPSSSPSSSWPSSSFSFPLLLIFR